MAEVLAHLKELACTQGQPLPPLLLCLAIAAPHFLYAYIWFYPAVWMRLAGKDAVGVFAKAGYVGKVLQFAAVLAWFRGLRPEGLCWSLGGVGLLQWLAFLVLTSYGQSLNVGIFQAIGHEGVYYGFKLGHKIPWVTGWPFDTVSHPQYVGSVLTVWGVAAAVWGAAPPGALLAVAGFWTAVYVVTAVQEQCL